jgi:hypothetical protein
MPTREQIWNALVDAAGEDAIASAASVGVERAEKELEAAGFDVKAERERASARVAELLGETEPSSDKGEATAWVSKAAPERKKVPGTRRAVTVAVALALATAAGVLYALASREKPHENPPVEVPRQGPAPTAPVAPPQTQQETPGPAPRTPTDKPGR